MGHGSWHKAIVKPYNGVGGIWIGLWPSPPAHPDYSRKYGARGNFPSSSRRQTGRDANAHGLPADRAGRNLRLLPLRRANRLMPPGRAEVSQKKSAPSRDKAQRCPDRTRLPRCISGPLRSRAVWVSYRPDTRPISHPHTRLFVRIGLYALCPPCVATRQAAQCQ